MCVFFAEISTAHHHNVVLQRSLSHTRTHTHTHDGPTVAARSSGSRFFGFNKKIFLTQKEVASFLLTDRGSRISENDLVKVNVFSYLCMYSFLTRALCRTGIP